MPTLLAGTSLFLWDDLENPTPAETRFVPADVFHFHPLSIEDCVTVSPSPKVSNEQLDALVQDAYPQQKSKAKQP